MPQNLPEAPTAQSGWRVTTDTNDPLTETRAAGLLRVEVWDEDEGLLVAGTAPRYVDDPASAVADRRAELQAAVLALAPDRPGELDAPPVPPRAVGRQRIGRLGKRFYYAGRLAIARIFRDPWRTLTGTHPVRVFTWHRITGLVRDGMTLDTDRFAQQVRTIAETHDVVSFEDGLASLLEAKPRRRPMAVLTFDDAYRSVFTNAFPVLRARGLPATLFVPTDFPGTTSRFPHDADCPILPFCDVMSWEEVAILREHGWTIGGHTASHARLRAGALDHADDEMRRCQAALTARGFEGALPMAFCFGRPEDCPRDAATRAMALGYSAVCTSLLGENHSGADPARLRRIDLGGDHPPHAWRAWIHGLVPAIHGPDA
jgi:hypothetical protein